MDENADCVQGALLNELRSLKVRVDVCLSGDERLSFEDDLHAILFKMVNQPLIELLAQVSIRFYRLGHFCTPFLPV